MSTTADAHEAAPADWGPAQEAASFEDLVRANYQRQQELRAGATDEAADRQHRRVQIDFQNMNGKIFRVFLGAHLPVGVALTEIARPFGLKELFRRRALLFHHRFVDVTLPAEVEAALADGDLLALKASGVLRDASERVVLERVMAAQSYLLRIIDSSKGRMPQPSSAATEVER
jgi:hypothetical protein